jgi:hypothetical protein
LAPSTDPKVLPLVEPPESQRCSCQPVEEDTIDVYPMPKLACG